jgi:hypothetical protein
MPALIAPVLAVLAGGLVLFGAPFAAIVCIASIWAALLWLHCRFTDHRSARLS